LWRLCVFAVNSSRKDKAPCTFSSPPQLSHFAHRRTQVFSEMVAPTAATSISKSFARSLAPSPGLTSPSLKRWSERVGHQHSRTEKQTAYAVTDLGAPARESLRPDEQTAGSWKGHIESLPRGISWHGSIPASTKLAAGVARAAETLLVVIEATAELKSCALYAPSASWYREGYPSADQGELVATAYK